MELYRLNKKRYAGDLSGYGASLGGGRWNSKGTALLYTAQSRSLALVESLVHLSTVNNLEDYQMMVIFVPDDASVIYYDRHRLPVGWEKAPSLTQTIGDQWATSADSLLLRVPSAVVINEYNFLINPRHRDAGKVQLVGNESFIFDTRLK